MARIRSIHPDQWCDEDFVELPMEARLLAIALRNFADDKGVFEWKPKTIKMKIFPADDVNIDAALDALLMQKQCIKFTSHGKTFGAIRNFCNFQRPKKPNDIFPISEEIAQYVGYKGEISTEIDAGDAHQIPHQLPTDTQIAPQMEEGIGGGVEIGKPISCPFPEFWAIWPNKVSKAAAQKAFKRLKPDKQRLAIDNAADWFSRWRLANPQASPIHATTYLNNSRWEDEPPPLTAINGGRNERPYESRQEQRDRTLADEIADAARAR